MRPVYPRAADPARAAGARTRPSPPASRFVSVAIEYLGNKSRLLDFVVGPIAELPALKTVADIFCGTASVSQALRQRGLRVVANDHMRLCATLAEAALLSDGPPRFAALAGPARERLRGESVYDAVVRTLNALPPEAGFFFRTYSPASAATGTTRMYLTELNAGKVDAIRGQIERWTPVLTRAERALLLRDLVQAVSAVSNTAGTYGCYLKTWKQRALTPLTLVADHPRAAQASERRGPRGPLRGRRGRRRRPRRLGRCRVPRPAVHQAPVRGLLPPAGDARRRSLAGGRGLDGAAALAGEAVGLLLQAPRRGGARADRRPARRPAHLPELQRGRAHRARGDPRDPRRARARPDERAIQSAVSQQRARAPGGGGPRAPLPRRRRVAARRSRRAGSRRRRPTRAPS